MNSILQDIKSKGIIPVIKIDDAAKALPLVCALEKGGVRCAEITFRTAAGVAALKEIAKNKSNILVGAGTVLTVEQARAAKEAGAKFIVSPGFNPKVAAFCKENALPLIPGCATPSDMERALDMGLELVKVFPAKELGGVSFIKAVAPCYPALRFMPTGGINQYNIREYLSVPQVAACAGSFVAPPELINGGNFDKISELCREAMSRALNFSLLHIGINGGNEADAKKAASRFEALFSFALRKTDVSYFAGRGVEVMSVPNAAGEHGHIAIGTTKVPVARAYLENLGMEFKKETAKKDAFGNTIFIYLKEEIAGFAVHLSECGV